MRYFLAIWKKCRTFLSDSRANQTRVSAVLGIAIAHVFFSLAAKVEDATRKLEKDDARTLPTLHVEMANSTRGIFNISRQMDG